MAPLKNEKHMTPDLSPLPNGQSRAVKALISGKRAPTYEEAARLGGMSLGTLYTHLRRVKKNHPNLYREIRILRKAQLAVRHQTALDNARAHTRDWFRRVGRHEISSTYIGIS